MQLGECKQVLFLCLADDAEHSSVTLKLGNVQSTNNPIAEAI